MGNLALALFVAIAIVCLIVAIIVSVFWVYNSIYFIGTDDKIEFYSLGGNYQRTVINRTYAQETGAANAAKGGNRVVSELGVAFGFWPLSLGYRVPTTQFEVPIHASQMYTSTRYDEAPRVSIEGDATLQFRLSDNPQQLGLAFPLFEQTIPAILSKERRNLKHACTIRDQVHGQEHEHHVLRIGKIFHSVLNKPVLDAMRTQATNFTFTTLRAGGEVDGPHVSDIVACKDRFSQLVKNALASTPNSVFVQGGLLEINEDGTAESGCSLLVYAQVIEKIELPPTEGASPAQQAISRPFIGAQEGVAERLVLEARAAGQRTFERETRLGQAAGVRELAEQLGITEMQVALALDTLRQREGTVNLVGADLVQALRQIVSGGPS